MFWNFKQKVWYHLTDRLFKLESFFNRSLIFRERLAALENSLRLEFRKRKYNLVGLKASSIFRTQTFLEFHFSQPLLPILIKLMISWILILNFKIKYWMHWWYESYLGLSMYKIIEISKLIFQHKDLTFLGIFESSFRELWFYDFWPLDGTKKFRCAFRNIQGQIRGTRYENCKNLQIRQNWLLHAQPYSYSELILFIEFCLVTVWQLAAEPRRPC